MAISETRDGSEDFVSKRKKLAFNVLVFFTNKHVYTLSQLRRCKIEMVWQE